MTHFQKQKRSWYRSRRRYRSPLLSAGRVVKERSRIKIPWVWALKLAKVLPIFGVVYFVFFSKFFAIQDVIIEGNSYIPTETIAQQIPRGKNIFLFKISSAKINMMRQLPEIRDLAIYRGLPNAIKVVVLEREGRIAWETSGERFLVSSQGEVAKRVMVGESIDGMPLIIDKQNFPVQVGSVLTTASFVSFVSNVYDQMYGVVNLRPTYFEVDETTFDIILHTEAGYYIKFNTMRSSRKQLENLKKVLVEKGGEVHEYIDLRIDGWAYYK
ncbi:MAG: cell division protein FtsQ [bacterium ADurb.Bin400]|nr:MAG: cell division protein FtsQ [bacterium ADurb.Bin400]